MQIVRIIQVLGIMVIGALLTISSAPFFFGTDPVTAQSTNIESFSTELTEQLAGIFQQKQALTLEQRKIDSRIMQVIQKIEKQISTEYVWEMPEFQDFSAPLLRTDYAGNIEIKLTVNSLTVERLEQLEDLGMDIHLTLPEFDVIIGDLPYDQIEIVAGLDFVHNVGTPGYPLHNTGDVTSQGDSVLRAAVARSEFDVYGDGIKVGVISDGVTHMLDSVATGDLPSPASLEVLKAGSGDEGTAMLEIIHDLAPAASLAFYAPDNSSDMIAGITALSNAGCHIIVDDLWFGDESKFEDGPIAQKARDFYTGGGLYVTSAGNNAQRHYMHQYVRSAGSPDDGYPYAHDYGGGDIGNTFVLPANRTIITILQWNNRWGQSGDDFDLVLARSSDGAVLTRSNNVQDGDDYPWEGLAWTNNTGASITVFIAIMEDNLVSPLSSLILDYHVHNGLQLQYSHVQA